tara:strand:- start:1407 stop:2687 length:1281 start_codon:yes stop_codon:yes gene_type:complete
MKNLLLSLLSIILSLPLFSQEIKTIYFEQDPIVRNPSGRGTEPIYRVTSDTLKYRGKGSLVKYPLNFASTDTGYFFTYFTGCKDGIIPKVQLVIVEDYKSQRPKLWVDQNGNFDISDDGDPVQVTEEGIAILKLRNCTNPQAGMYKKFFRPKLDSSDIARLENWAKPGLLKNKTYREKVPFWFASQRMDTKVYRGLIDGQKVSLGLNDWNCDGMYSRNVRDKLMVGKLDDKVLSYRIVKGAVNLKDTSIFFINRIPYEVVEIEKTGQYIKIKESSTPFKAPIIIGDTLSNYSFPFADDSLNIDAALNGKDYLIIDVWGTWCAGCTQQVPFIKAIYKEYADIINIIGLNQGDSRQGMDEFKEKFAIEWESGKLTKEIKDDLNIEGFPTYMLIDSNRKLLMYDTIPFYIQEFLKEMSELKAKAADKSK